MWVLVIALFSSIPSAHTSKGSISAKFASQEQCLKAKEQLTKAIHIDNYRLSANCIFIGHI